MTQKQMDILKALYSKETTERIQPNFKDVKITADNIAEIIILADAIYSDNFQTVNDNIDDIKINATQSANISALANIKDILTSLVNDKTTLDSLYADKITLDGLYALKSKIDSLFADKIKLDSLYADKPLLDAVNENKLNIDAVSKNLTEIINSLDNANMAKEKALESKGFRDEAEEFKNQAQSIAGGSTIAEDVIFSTKENLEIFKKTLLISFTNVDNKLATKATKAQVQSLNLSSIAETTTLKYFTDTLKTKLEALDDKTTLDNKISKAVPIGTQSLEILESPRPNQLIQSGGTFNRADYPDLWAFIQTQSTLLKNDTDWQTENTANAMCGYFSEGDGSTTFRLMNLIDATLIGDTNAGIYHPDGIKSHGHSGTAGRAGAHTHPLSYGSLVIGGNYYPDTGNYKLVSGTSGSGGNHTHPLSINNTGNTYNTVRSIGALPLIVAK